MTSERIYDVIIVDDEPNCIKVLNDDLLKYKNINVIATFTDPVKAEQIIIRRQPDILFLDIEIPRVSGVELLQKMRPYIHSRINIVFYSAYDRYMKEALQNSAFDFLLKPYTSEELDNIINRIKVNNSKSENFEQSMLRLLSNDTKFAMQTITGIRLLKCNDIVYSEYNTDIRCWQLILIEGETIKLKSNTKADNIISLNRCFVRVSQNCIVNTDHLVSIENNTMKCIFFPPFDRHQVYASRRYYSKLKDELVLL